MLKMGCAKVDITPGVPVFLRGYGSRNALSDGIEERLEAGVMILAQGRKRILVLTLDNLGISIQSCRSIYADLKKQCGFDENSTYLCCSHTHFAPGICDYYVTVPKGQIEIGRYPAEKGYYPLLLRRLVAGVKEAEANLEAVELEETVIPVSCLSFNRRPIQKTTGKVVTNYTWPTETADEYDFPPVDTQFYVWRFKAGGALKAILGRFSCHPVTGGNDQYAVSADYPGYFQKYIKEYFGCPGFFMLGNAGDVVPIQRKGTARSDIGRVLASAVRLAERTFRKVETFKLDNTIVTVPLKLRVKCSRRKAEQLWQNALAEAKAGAMGRHDLAMMGYKHNFVNMYPSDDVEVPLRLLRLGSKVLVGLPFEVLTEIGLRLRKACPEAVLTSITGGYDGYLPLAKDYKYGGYETVTGARFNVNAGDRVLAAAIKAVQEFQAK